MSLKWTIEQQDPNGVWAHCFIKAPFSEYLEVQLYPLETKGKVGSPTIQYDLHFMFQDMTFFRRKLWATSIENAISIAKLKLGTLFTQAKEVLESEDQLEYNEDDPIEEMDLE